MRYFPTFFQLSEKACLVVGAGETALRKVRLLRKAGAEITVVTDALDPREIASELLTLERDTGLRIERRKFRTEDVEHRALVVSATEIPERDALVADTAREAGRPVNVVDRPDLSDFITPAIVDRDPITIAISSAGTAPVLARRLRSQIEAMLPARLGALAEFADSFRAAVKANIQDGRGRLRFWERFFDGPEAASVLSGDETAAREQMLTLVNAASARQTPKGRVAIVGAGPGDPDLLTFKAMRALQHADVVVYDKLVGPEILDYARRDAERIYVGKTRGHHTRSQDEINAILVREARLGKHVVRLKGGDPFIFGRGGEEQDMLAQHGIDVEVVPGITAAAGCAAASGIPLTHREHAQAVTFVTGHAKDGEPDLDWAALAGLKQTLVIYMGVSTIGRTCERLIEQGLNPQTPAAVIENGTLPEQRTVTGSLADLAALVAANGIKGPGLFIVGDVVSAAGGAATVASQAVAGISTKTEPLRRVAV
ncbi:siroheme synthase CysG [Denitrobaculum tricleocarpae]|uniref:Uroporphyrinogen-III C-methyltransferase n=1 Tax=Denitrobaculum tricleocarpae TaxID=2591009 RepID=A0A545TXI7_9PROT|nr:siroheme synthase CysG [Denitrobaculum tricleocarpae]TQV81935.1 uroporphyrinogen-III C-methyltransferase [Denitrobaculum tricleocarpae]